MNGIKRYHKKLSVLICLIFISCLLASSLYAEEVLYFRDYIEETNTFENPLTAITPALQSYYVVYYDGDQIDYIKLIQQLDAIKIVTQFNTEMSLMREEKYVNDLLTLITIYNEENNPVEIQFYDQSSIIAYIRKQYDNPGGTLSREEYYSHVLLDNGTTSTAFFLTRVWKYNQQGDLEICEFYNRNSSGRRTLQKTYTYLYTDSGYLDYILERAPNGEYIRRSYYNGYGNLIYIEFFHNNVLREIQRFNTSGRLYVIEHFNEVGRRTVSYLEEDLYDIEEEDYQFFYNPHLPDFTE